MNHLHVSPMRKTLLVLKLTTNDFFSELLVLDIYLRSSLLVYDSNKTNKCGGTSTYHPSQFGSIFFCSLRSSNVEYLSSLPKPANALIDMTRTLGRHFCNLLVVVRKNRSLVASITTKLVLKAGRNPISFKEYSTL